jgi:predicted RNA-binding protein with PIN domain
MAGILIVDGYNILHSWSHLNRAINEVGLEAARERLISELEDYAGTTRTQVVVVFDAYHTDRMSLTQHVKNRVEVVFTRKKETADHYIERVVTSLPKHYKVRVATGDGLEQLIIYGQGAIRMTARELWNEVQAVETELRERFIENRPPKNNILADHLDEESLAWFEALRRQK